MRVEDTASPSHNTGGTTITFGYDTANARTPVESVRSALNGAGVTVWGDGWGGFPFG